SPFETTIRISKEAESCIVVKLLHLRNNTTCSNMWIKSVLFKRGFMEIKNLFQLRKRSLNSTTES
ncbi:MAG: hypothetical protein K6E21_01930, partial [Bacilli bacterium]|nr:hypothetical protein [Bacilli bacterium]